MKRLFVLALAILALPLTSCETAQRFGAAGDVHRFLIAIRDDDKPAFDLYVDKPALTAELEAKLAEVTRSQSGTTAGQLLGAVLGGSFAKTAANAALRPEVFRVIAVSFGYSADRPIPSQLTIAEALRPVADGQVCAAKRKDSPCLLTFTHEADAWKLTAVDMSALKL